MSFNSALYVGAVFHQRLRPRPHRLRYRMFWLLLDIDELDVLDRELRLFSHQRWNAVSFDDRNHGDRSARTLRAQVEQHLRDASITANVGAIRLLCLPRIFGYGFNPLSVFYCYDRAGTLIALLYEVHNTFQERHSYVIPVQGSQTPVHQACDKEFYVSPFFDLEMGYQFRTSLPDATLRIGIRGGDAEGPLISTGLTGTRRALSDRALLRVLVTHPLLTLKVIAAIHWHALRLWLKGITVRQHLPPRQPAVTIVRAD